MRMISLHDEPSPSGTPGRDWFTPGRFAWVLALLIAVTFPLAISGQQTFFHRDFAIFGYPLALEHRTCFWQGEWPLWNPFNNCGLPFLAQWNTLTLYPGALVYLGLPLSWSLGWFCLIHLYAAGVGMFFLARSWTRHEFAAAVAGIGFTFSGLALSCVKWPNNIAALAWMPWVVLTVPAAWRSGGGRVYVAVLVAGMQLLCGAPEIILFTWLFLAAYAVFDTWAALAPSQNPGSPRLELRLAALLAGRRGLRFALVAGLAAGVAAAQLGPFIDLLLHSQRQPGFAGNEWAMPWWGWANYVVPLFRCFESHQGVFAQQDQYWVSSYYAGIAVLALAWLATGTRRTPRAAFLAGVILLSLLAALGPGAGVGDALRALVPPLRVMRFPIKFVVLASFCLPLLAAEGVRALDAMKPGEVHRHFLKVVLGLAILIGVLLGVAWEYPLPRDSWTHTWQSGASRWILLILFFGLWRYVFSERARRSAWPGPLALAAILWLDGVSHAPTLNPTVERWVYAPQRQGMNLYSFAPIPRWGESRAMVTPDAEFRADHLVLTNAAQDVLASRLALFANCNLIDEIPKTDGFFSLYLRPMANLMALDQQPGHFARARLADFLGISQMTSPGKIFEWNARPSFMPLATAGQRPVYTRATWTAPPGLFQADFDPAKEVVLLEKDRAEIGVTNLTRATAQPVRLGRHRLEWQVDAVERGLLVIAQAFYHPWRATVDGVPTAVYRANYAFQAVAVPPGSHRVILVYRDWVFQAGIALSVGCLAWCGFGCWRYWRDRPAACGHAGDRSDIPAN